MPPKKKAKRNISGLRNQPKSTADSSHTEELSSCGPDFRGSAMLPDPQIDKDADDEEWTPNMQFDSNKPAWDGDESEDEIGSENEEDFLDQLEDANPGVNPGKYRNRCLYVALMRMAIDVGDDPTDEDWVPKKTRKKLRKEKKSPSFSFNFLDIILNDTNRCKASQRIQERPGCWK